MVFTDWFYPIQDHEIGMASDSIDFLEDALVNLLVLLALGWSARSRGRVSMLLAGLILIPALATLWTAYGKFTSPLPPSPIPLSLTGLGACAINFVCALMLSRFREQGGSLTRAAFFSARNDVLANVAIIAAGLATAFHPSAWPVLIVGLGNRGPQYRRRQGGLGGRTGGTPDGRPRKDLTTPE